MAETRSGFSDKILAFDIGTAAIKIAEAMIANGAVSFRNVAFRSIMGEDLSNPASLGSVVREMILEAKMTAVKALFVLSGGSVTIRQMDFPKMTSESLEKTIKFELKKDLSFSIEECSLEYKIVKEYEEKNEGGISQKKIRVLAAAVDRRICEKYVGLATELGLETVGVVSSAVSLFSYSGKSGFLDGLESDQVAMFLDFGNSQITVSFISRSGLKFSKEINMGGSALTTVIKTMYPGEPPLSITEAEEKKFGVGILPQEKIDGLDDSEPHTNLHKVLNVSFKKLFQRIRLSTGYYSAHFQDTTMTSQTLKKIVLYGGNSEIPGVDSFFIDSYDALVAKADAWKAFGRMDAGPGAKYNLSFVNISAAVGEFAEPEYGINFFRKAEKKEAQPTSQERIDAIGEYITAKVPMTRTINQIGFVNAVILLTAVYVVVFFFLFMNDFLQGRSYNSERETLEVKTGELSSNEAAGKRRKINEQFDFFQKKLKAREVIEFSRDRLDLVLAKLSEQLPEGAHLTLVNFTADENPVLMFSGVTDIYDKVIKLSDNLKKSPAFAQVDLKKSDQTDSRIEFQFECVLARKKDEK